MCKQKKYYCLFGALSANLSPDVSPNNLLLFLFSALLFQLFSYGHKCKKNNFITFPKCNHSIEILRNPSCFETSYKLI